MELPIVTTPVEETLPALGRGGDGFDSESATEQLQLYGGNMPGFIKNAT